VQVMHDDFLQNIVTDVSHGVLLRVRAKHKERTPVNLTG
jgi:hypothetical protein